MGPENFDRADLPETEFALWMPNKAANEESESETDSVNSPIGRRAD
jgi:hypothetical protein